MKIITLITIIFLLPGCAVVPKLAQDADDSRCNLLTRKMELDTIGNGNVNCSINDGRAALICIGFVGTIAAATTIISGSIVLAGNTVHWVEKQGKCDDSFINTYLVQHNQPLLENNGELIDFDEYN